MTVTEFFDVTPHIQHQEYKTRRNHKDSKSSVLTTMYGSIPLIAREQRFPFAKLAKATAVMAIATVSKIIELKSSTSGCNLQCLDNFQLENLT